MAGSTFVARRISSRGDRRRRGHGLAGMVVLALVPAACGGADSEDASRGATTRAEKAAEDSAEARMATDRW